MFRMSLLSAMQSVKNLMLVMVVVLTTLQSAQCQADPPPNLFKFPNLPNIYVDLGDSVDLTFLALDSNNGGVTINITEHRRNEILNYHFNDHNLSLLMQSDPQPYGVSQLEGVLIEPHIFLLSIKIVNDESAANTTGIEVTMMLKSSGSISVSINDSMYVTLLKENSSACQCSSDDEMTTPTTYSTTNVMPSQAMPTNATPSQATPSNVTPSQATTSTGTASNGTPPPCNTPSDATPSNTTPTPSALTTTGFPSSVLPLADRGSTVLGVLVIGIVIVIVLQGLTLLLTFWSNKTNLFHHQTSSQDDDGHVYENKVDDTSQGGSVLARTDASGNFTMKRREEA